MEYKYQTGGHLEPFDADMGDGDFNPAMERAGYFNTLTYGDEEYFGLDVWKHTGGVEKWVLVISDGGSYCPIFVEGWPAFLDALARYAPIAAMSQRQVAADVAQAVRLGRRVPGDPRPDR